MLSAIKNLLYGLVICLALCLVLLVQITTVGANAPQSPVQIDPILISYQPEIINPGEEFFVRNCVPCHDVHSAVIGPALG